MTKHRNLNLLERFSFYLVSPAGWRAKREDLDAINEHLHTEHLLAEGQKGFEQEEFRHLAAFDRKEFNIVGGRVEKVI